MGFLDITLCELTIQSVRLHREGRRWQCELARTDGRLVTSEFFETPTAAILQALDFNKKV